jgi:glycosyltransferase involved in cell wall biosynthesis
MSELEPSLKNLIFTKELTINIITVVYNGIDFIEATIKSVINQTYPNINYIIIDGGSSDGTVEIIKKYEHKLHYWISEPDKGIYDAMNKALSLITEGYIWFINAGDQINDENTTQTIVNSGIYDIYYGKISLIHKDQTIIKTLSVPSKLHWYNFRRGMPISHQAIIVHKKIADLYNLDFKCIADSDWIIKAFKKTNSITYVDIVFSKYMIEGFSDTNFKKCWAERFKLMKIHYGQLEYWMVFYYYSYAILQRIKISWTRK